VGKSTFVLTTSILIGVAALGCVQGVVNANHGSFSFMVQTNNLFDYHLTQGIQHGEYATSFGSPYPRPDIHFIDREGRQILEREGISDAFLNKGQYMRLALKYPYEFICIYTRHFVNMLNPIFGDTYIKDFSPFYLKRLPMSLINYCIMFVVCAGFILRKRGDGDNGRKSKMPFWKRLVEIDYEKAVSVAFMAVLLAPCLFILPGTVEQRFFFPFYVLLYGALAFLVDIRYLGRIFAQRPALTVVAFVVPYLVLSAMWTANYASNAENYLIR